MASKAESPEKSKVPSNRGQKGTYVAYDRKGEEIWRSEGFSLGVDHVPTGISITMGAGIIVDPGTGERLHAWDPWHVLANMG